MRIDKPELVNALATVLSDSVVLSYKLQGAHWNVVGPDFNEYHDFFAKIYEDVDGAIDATAENIRKLGANAPSRLIDFARLATVDADSEPNNTPSALLSDIHAALEATIASTNYAFKMADSFDEQGIADFLAGRDDMLKKWRWQVAASLHNGESYEG